MMIADAGDHREDLRLVDVDDQDRDREQPDDHGGQDRRLVVGWTLREPLAAGRLLSRAIANASRIAAVCTARRRR